MYRVVTTYRNGSTRPVVERGPWHPSRKIAEDWAETLRVHGYAVSVESQSGMIDVGGGVAGDDNADLMSALASMA
ncbi:MAG: SUKH-3 domain-containing protein [Azonexaceae bacterium]|nr:SUKH-3 domain-containing protein [Azonexaceae bacterium]